MRIISFIEDQEIIKAILKHLGFWESCSRPPAKAPAPPSVSNLAEEAHDLLIHDNPIYGHPQYPWEAYV